ncbi:MAG: winged helix-turn-helix domain-containing tetratricopeptide repeat protein, partial [Pyrinomonadaceae bacterium]
MSLGKHPDSLLNFSGREMNAKEGHSYCFRSFRLDVEERRLFDNGVPVSLEPKVFDVLAALVLRNGHLVEKEELLHLVWSDSFVEEANIARIVYTLRKVLGEDENGNKFIETVAKKGYRFVAEVDEIREPAAANSANDNPDSRETAETPSAVESHTPTFESDATRSPSVAMPKRNVRIILFGVGFLSAIFLTVLLSFNFQPDPSVSPNEVKSIAVLPFVNATGDTNTEYVSDGISDSIINSLSRLPDMKVIALTSVLRYKGKQIDPQTVGRELNVNAVLMGRLTQQGENLAISAELVDVRDNRRLWGGQYSSNLSDLLVVQGEIARQISDGLRLRLSAEEKKQLVKQYTENAEAYQLYILGRHYSNKLTKEGFEKSIEYYEQAIKKDPSYALPYTGIAFSYYFMGNRGFWTAKESGQKLEWAALKALELDDALADGHVFLGVSKYSNFDWTGAEKEIIKALELEPNSYLANFTFFTYLSNVGRFDEALFYGKRAAELDQTTQPGLLAYAYFVARQYDKA